MIGLYDTIQLNTSTWDLMLDPAGNIAVQTQSAAVAQDVASVCRTFQGEVWYDTSLGIPYFQQILGQMPPSSLLATLYNQAALTVPGVTSAQTTFTSVGPDRKLAGVVEVIDLYGQSINASF